MNILYLSFYFEPDLCAGSFRNTTLVNSLIEELNINDHIDIIATQPNRYKSYKKEAPNFEEKAQIKIHRIKVKTHQSGFVDQIRSFYSYYKEAIKITKTQKYDLVFASSSRLFTAYLGYIIAKKKNIPLYLDVRDIFVDTMENVLKNPVIKSLTIPIIKLVEKRTFDYATHINLISAGFNPYFEKFKCNSFSNYTNGIDEEFLDKKDIEEKIDNDSELKTIVYAGNIGEGQGLEKIIPISAKLLGDNYRFIIIGDGGSKSKLKTELLKNDISNVELKKPLSREELKKIYHDADFLFLHLNNYEAFKKVLPSKIFELAATNKPLIAGVSGYANDFIKQNIENVILFQSCDIDSFIEQMNNYKYKRGKRSDFIDKFRRETINKQMANSIMSILS